MNGDVARSEIITFGFVFLNCAAVILGLVWAWRRGWLKNLDDASYHAAFELPPDASPSKENGNG